MVFKMVMAVAALLAGLGLFNAGLAQIGTYLSQKQVMEDPGKYVRSIFGDDEDDSVEVTEEDEE